jgi:hypothetical protein
MPLKILHIYKESYKDINNSYQGATKDICGRTEYFDTRNIYYRELLTLDSLKYYESILSIGKNELKRYDAAILEMTYSPYAVRLLKYWVPRIKIIVRSHNAELLHRLHWMRSQSISVGAMKSLRHAFLYFIYDYCCGKYSDYIASISGWEIENYWKIIADRSKLYSVPFFLPKKYLKKLPKALNKKSICINLTASAPNPIIADATKNFIFAVRNLDICCSEWSFYVTGNPRNNKIKKPSRIIWTGLLKDPYEIMSESRAIALLSDFGYGFKTKIIEAILTKNYILLTKGLFKRLPEEIVPYCISVDIYSKISFQEALERCKAPYPENDVNELFRKQAFDALDRVLF